MINDPCLLVEVLEPVTWKLKRTTRMKLVRRAGWNYKIRSIGNKGVLIMIYYYVDLSSCLFNHGAS